MDKISYNSLSISLPSGLCRNLYEKRRKTGASLSWQVKTALENWLK